MLKDIFKFTMADNALINTLLLANSIDLALPLREALSDTSKVWVSTTTDGALDVLSDSSIELIISTTDFASSGLSFFEQIMPDHPDPIRILISEQDKMDNAIDAINKGRIYKNILNPWTEEDIVTIAREASELYHLRTDLDKKVSEFSEQLIQAELYLEALIEDIEASKALDAQTKLDYITRLKSTITLLGTPLD